MQPTIEQEPETRLLKRGVYLLPNLLTIIGLFAGFYSIVAGMKGYFNIAAEAIFIAMIMDALDGRVARLTNTQSAFGMELDSLSDAVSFGVAPALVMYSWSLVTLGKIGWLASFIFAAAGVLRLARFNTQVGSADKRYFQGIPIPGAAGIIASMVWMWYDYTTQSKWFVIVMFL
ncbi:MAG: CDP-diacylglycerol--serine O-phosphatidyltransferase, partial [Gammaproteobacteria bacterium]